MPGPGVSYKMWLMGRSVPVGKQRTQFLYSIQFSNMVQLVAMLLFMIQQAIAHSFSTQVTMHFLQCEDTVT